MSDNLHDESPPSNGPLTGIRAIELAGVGPGPHAALLLADLGADVVRVQRPGEGTVGPTRPQLRGRTVVEADLKSMHEIERVRGLIDRADVLIEGFRPGVTERMGLGPDTVCTRNPRLVYARITGWGQYGPRATRAGHDINYLGLTGLLNAIGRAGERPVPPMNLASDFGGGSMFLVFGILAALIERQRSGAGQVIDAAMVDGTLALGHMIWGMHGMGVWSEQRGTNLLDTGMACYDTYETADGKYMAVGALEPKFYAQFVHGMGLDPDDLPSQFAPESQPTLRTRFTERFAQKTREEWTAIFDGTDACVTPVLSFSEATRDAHLSARRSLIPLGGVMQHAPAPRFSRTPAPDPAAPPVAVTPIDDVWQPQK